jgi:hypothetical protein
VESTAGGSAGSVVRVGLYAALNGDDAPGALLYGSATIASTGTGTLEATSVATDVLPGLYFVAAVVQVAAPTLRSITTTGSALVIPESTFGGTSVPNSYTKTSVSSTLPDPFGTPSGTNANPPLVGVYIA